VIVLDRLLVGSLKFVLGKVAAAVEAELDDDSTLREELLAAQMRLELGELSPEQFAAVETEILLRLREIQQRRRAATGGGPSVGEALGSGDYKIAGIEAELHDGSE